MKLHMDQIIDPLTESRILLVGPLERARLEKAVADDNAKAKFLKGEGLVADAAVRTMNAMDNQSTLDADSKIRSQFADQVSRLVIQYDEPSEEQVIALEDLTTAEKGITAKVKRQAYKNLSPRVVSGADGPEVPVKCLKMVQEACYEAHFPTLTEELRDFLQTSSPSTSEAAS